MPLVDATRLATGWPLIFSGVVSTSDENASTSGAAGRLALIVDQPLAPTTRRRRGWIGRERYGTGFAGSETYSSNGAPPAAGAANPAFRPAAEVQRRRRARVQPLAHPAGHAGSRRHVFVPGFECRDRRHVRLRRVVLQIVIEERPQDLAGGNTAPCRC